jgi:two-component system nitrogen regulation response regulator GlnG
VTTRRDLNLETDTGQPTFNLPEPVRLPALTLLYHPQMARAGERSRLPGLGGRDELQLSRLQPDFFAKDAVEGHPIGDRFVSRSPILLRGLGSGAVEIARPPDGMWLQVDGAEVEASVTLLPERLEAGVLIELAHRVVCLLHLAGPPGATDPDDLGMVGDSEPLRLVRQRIRHVGDLTVPVLVRGDTGTGKELAARAIHRRSGRQGPLVAVNLGAIAPTLVTSELFGHVRGAFSGADRDRKGYFEEADGGTLFLDEVGEAPPEVQVMLLRTLETGEVQRVGASQPRRVDVRVVAATDTDLERAAHEGRFKAPLLHRLAGYEIHLPRLAERRDDIGQLLVRFLREELAALGEPGLGAQLEDPNPGRELWLPPSLVADLCRFPWPGNLRQLRNVVRQLVISSRGAAQITMDAAVSRILSGGARAPAASEPTPAAVERRRPAEVTEDELVAALRQNRWKIQKTADVLGISKNSLYGLIDRSGTLRKAREIPAEEIHQAFEAKGGDLEAMAAELQVSLRGLQLRLKELERG